MDAPTTTMDDIEMPSLPAKHEDFLEYVAKRPHAAMQDLLEPYKKYDVELRKVFAQHPDHPAINQPNVTPVFAGHEGDVKVHARDRTAESDKEKASYVMPLKDEDRKPDGVPAIVGSVRDFKTNFNIFSESSLSELDWSHVVAAGSSVVTPLLAVPEKHAGSKRALRAWYHEELAPASDVDLFLYDLTEDQAVEKIKQIERSVRDALLVETTTIRTKNTITIVSQHPVRHIQIVLRIYKSISEMLTGFDVDCSCVAYDGQQVWASPRALAAFMTQMNTVDLTRRSPSYENRLSKYAKRGFEIHCPDLDRSKVDPTIFERSFTRTEGLARLLVLEKLPNRKGREDYLDQRREERGRPPVNRWPMRSGMLPGNIKDDWDDEVAEWVDSDAVSDYHTFTIPYGPKYHARKIEKLLYTKDMLLNAEWNKPKVREVNLHRHPAFFGTADDVMQDCCGYCPKPSTIEEEEFAEKECKTFVSGAISFTKDDPGRQAIGSFHPLTAEGWTEMAYVSNTGMLCQAIVDGDAEYVRSWLEQEGNDPNARDWTGRAPLHLAVAASTLEIVQLLIDHGARLVARLVDGKTALHLAAMRGEVDMVSALLRKSEANEAEHEDQTDARRAQRKAAKAGNPANVDMQGGDASSSPHSEVVSQEEEEDSDVDMMDDEDDDEDIDATTENSMVKIRAPAPDSDDRALAADDEDEPDVYDVNVLAWDTAVSPLHLAIVGGHVSVAKCLVGEFGADLLLPIKLFHEHDKSARAAILTLVLAIQLPTGQAEGMVRTLIHLGASSAQADLNQVTALQYCIADQPDQLETLMSIDNTGVTRAINHLSVSGRQWDLNLSGPLLTAIKARDSVTASKLLSAGSKPMIDFKDYMKAYKTMHDPLQNSDWNRRNFETSVEQPIIAAVKNESPLLAKALVVDHAADPNTLTPDGHRALHDDVYRGYREGQSVLDAVRTKIELLRNWTPEEQKLEAPLPLEENDSYLSKYKHDSYAFWSAQKQLDSAKATYGRDLEVYEEDVKRSEEDKQGLPAKRSAVSELLRHFEDLEFTLIAAGAKTFSELHSDIEPPKKDDGVQYNHVTPKRKPFQPDLTFRVGDLDDETTSRYVRLFEASWTGDVVTVKDLTLNAYTYKDAEHDEERPPLQIAVQDQHGVSPLAIAVAHSNFELASVIMQIAEAQYDPPDAAKPQRFRMYGGEDADSEDDNSDDDMPIYSELVDEQFTVENIGEVSMQVKSEVDALTMLGWPCLPVAANDSTTSKDINPSTGFSYLGPRKAQTAMWASLNSSTVHASSGTKLELPCNLFQSTVFHNNLDGLTYLLDMFRRSLLIESSRDDSEKRFHSISLSDFTYLIKADNPSLIEAVIRSTGAGVPFDDLAKNDDSESMEKPKYYQGLSVHGQKRKDWAAAGRGRANDGPTEKHQPPLLVAAHQGSLKLVEWFLSDAPMRCYTEFARANEDDKRLLRLARVAGSFTASTKQFLSARSDLSIHCYLMGNRTSDDGGKMLRYLVDAMPSSVNAKSTEGLTPLSIAIELYDDVAVGILIGARADQTTRDKYGNNVLHRLLSRPIHDHKQLKKLAEMLDFIDKRIRPSMFLERSAEHPGSLTPLARWLTGRSGRSWTEEIDADTVRILLRYSGGVELNQVNGEGDTPLHVTVRRDYPHLVKVILDHDSTLLNRENSTGRTPFEMAEDAAIAALCSEPPTLPEAYHYNYSHARKHGLPDSWASDLVDRPTSDFVEDAKRHEPEKRALIWDLLQETKRKLDTEGRVKRRLVTLNEANEVARRLAAAKTAPPTLVPESDGGAPEQGTDPVDEVKAWLPLASPRF